MKCVKRLSSLLFALVLALALPVQVLAETYYLEDGSVIVTTDDANQYVAQGGGESQKQTTETIITQRDSSAAINSTITVDTSASGAKAAEITIQDVNISTPGTAIEVGASNATIHVEGTNTVTAAESNAAGTYCGEAAIQVSSGDLTITGGADDTLNASVAPKNAGSSSYTAVIGSDAYDDLDGSITIQGSLTVNAETGGSGAAIGSGNSGDISGTISIQGGNVNAESHITAIGAGSGGTLNTGGSVEISGGNVTAVSSGSTAIGAYFMNGGSITISGGTVNATGGAGFGYGNGAGIGGVYTLGAHSAGGSINITGGTVTAVGGDGGAGIGNGSSSGMTADITITGGTVTAIGGKDAAGIGNNGVESKITIGGDATVIAQAGEATKAVAPNAIGNGGDNSEPYWASGSVTITDNAQVYLADNGTTKPEAQYYPNSGTTISGNAAVTQSSEDALTIRDRILAEQNKPAPQPEPTLQPEPTPQPEPEVKEEKAAPSFWDTILWKLKKAEDGTQFTIDAAGHTWMPRSILTTAREKNITLVIRWDGGNDITVSPTADMDLSLWCIQLKDLA